MYGIGMDRDKDCPNCNRGVAEEWNYCPMCGEKLNEEEREEE